ncbi:MAG TPA: NIPSNAP family protein [Bryobacteraceae bacterium]|nr:NIPSNAP family protein [Bryobacteraceae bacterium]
MDRRHMLAGLAASTLMGMEEPNATRSNTYLELKTWRLHNSSEHQPERVAEYLENGMAPALTRGGAKLAGAFANVIGPDGPYYVTLTQYSSLAAMQDILTKLAADETYQRELQKLSNGPGLPFVRVESSLLRSFDIMPEPAVAADSEKRAARVFELRTYESQTFVTLARKVAMFNSGEAQIFERLGMRPVFFGETIVGPRQPNLTYMLSFDSLAERDRLWSAFGSDPEWKKLSSRPELKDAEIVANISNVILRPLPFSAIQ